MNVTTVLSFLAAMVLLLGGFALMGYAFDTPGFEFVMFLGGCIAVFLASAIGALLGRSVTRKPNQR